MSDDSDPQTALLAKLLAESEATDSTVAPLKKWRKPLTYTYGADIQIAALPPTEDNPAVSSLNRLFEKLSLS